jgi:zinc transport system substrate-binding protein
MQELARSTAWITAGTDFDLAMEPKIRAQFPKLTVIDGTRGVVFRRMTEAHAHDEDHDGDSEDDGDGREDIDRHSWLGREPAKLMTDHVRDALIAADPAQRDRYLANAEALKRVIDAAFAELSVTLAHKRGSTVYVFHPAFGYFLDEFGIRQEAVEMGGKEPTPKALSDLAAKAKRDGARTIFVQEQFPVAAARHVANVVGATVLPLNPLDPDWLGNIRRMGESLAGK